MYEASYLSILLKPNYEKPVDTAQDVLDRGLTVIHGPGRESIREILKNSPSKIIRELANRTIIPKVIFCNVAIFPILILNLPKRIGINMMNGLNIKFL